MNAIDYSLGLKLQDYSKPLSCKIKDFLKDIVTYLTTIFMMLLLLSSGLYSRPPRGKGSLR